MLSMVSPPLPFKPFLCLTPLLLSLTLLLPQWGGLLFSLAAAAESQPQVLYKFEKQLEAQLPQGRVIGSRKSYMYQNHRYDVAEFLGIPFAEPPTGANRFKRPVKLTRFKQNPLNAQKFGPGCPQNIDETFKNTSRYSDRERAASEMWNVMHQSEDCLSVNVWTPYPFQIQKSAALRPVMLWIFGGGFYSGGSSLDVYQGHRLAALEDVVVVSFNYRVGLFGFFYWHSLAQSGNQGLYDQVMAMEWVQEHIHVFGGSGEKVTLFGESAGGASVGLHCVSPLSRGLFSKAILQSGSPTAPWVVLTKQETIQRADVIKGIVEKSCPYHYRTTLECLQDLSVEAIKLIETALWNVQSERYLPFPVGAYVDGEFLPDLPLNLLRRGDFADVPVLLGSNKNEGFSFAVYFLSDFFHDFSGTNPLSAQQYDAAITQAFGRYPGPVVEAIRFYYRNWSSVEDPDSNRLALDRATGEQNFMCPINLFAQHFATAAQKWPLQHSNTFVYMYYLRHRAQGENWPEWMGVIHGADCEWIFGKYLDQERLSPEERLFNRHFMSHWANFARNSDPSLVGAPDPWPRWENHSQQAKVLDVQSELLKGGTYVTGPRSNRCAFWNNYIPSLLNTSAAISRLERQLAFSANIHISSQLFTIALFSSTALLQSLL